MAVTITEYQGFASVSGHAYGPIPQDQSSTSNTTILSSATTSTMLLQSNTQLIRISSTAGNCWVLCTGSSISTSLATSTNCAQTFPNTYDYRGVKPGSRLTCLST